MIYICTPFREDKDLGKAYNDFISALPENSWICVLDYDAMFLHHSQINRMYDYIEAYPDTGIFVAYGSRTHIKSRQRFTSHIDSTDIKNHLNTALLQLDEGLKVKELKKDIGGFLMLFNKSTWEENKFPEGVGCLGVDTVFSRNVLKTKKILLMESIYVWHTYRLLNGVLDKTHLI